MCARAYLRTIATRILYGDDALGRLSIIHDPLESVVSARSAVLGLFGGPTNSECRHRPRLTTLPRSLPGVRSWSREKLWVGLSEVIGTFIRSTIELMDIALGPVNTLQPKP